MAYVTKDGNPISVADDKVHIFLQYGYRELKDYVPQPEEKPVEKPKAAKKKSAKK